MVINRQYSLSLGIFISKTYIFTSLAKASIIWSIFPYHLPFHHLRIVPFKYNIIVRLWTCAFYPLYTTNETSYYYAPHSLSLSLAFSFSCFLFLLLSLSLTFTFSCFLFLSTTGSSLLLRFLILISMLSLISTIAFEEPGVIAMLMLTSCLS